MIQKLQGVKITPRGSDNRFVKQNWPNSYAFGGWIYSANVSIGYNDNPTEIRMSIVLETSTFSQSAAKFDILESDLRCDAGNGGLNNETWFDIDLEGLLFKNFLLYQYDFSIESNQKILNILFKDYSILLDKIYIGLYKKQSYKENFIKSAKCEINLPIRCQDCEYNGSAIIGTGSAYRDIGFASYAGVNGKIFDNFSNFYYGAGNVYDAWNQLISNTGVGPGKFDLNGGYLIIGTESATEERCNSSPNITYSFIELLASLRKNGMKFIGSFPTGLVDSDFIYRANHIGSLREVLQNWCSDLGYTFYCSGRSFVGIDLKNPIDISNIANIADPTTNLGKYFVINNRNTEIGGSDTNSAILSFKSSFSLDNTFKQSVIVENSYPTTESNTSKTVKRYVGITPLHPISLNQYDRDNIADSNIYGEPFIRPRFDIKWYDNQYVNGDSLYANFEMLDGRSYYDVDAAIALSNYNDVLRDLFVAQRVLYNVRSLNASETDSLANPYCLANFNALGMFPILEIDDSQIKADIITDYFSNGEKDDVSNLNMESEYFRVFVGFYNEDLKNEIVSWEKNAANSMYKYGVVTNGPLRYAPYVSPDVLSDVSPTLGFYGKDGLIYNRIKNNFTPSADRYASVKYTPFLDVLLYDGLVRSSSEGIYPENNPNYPEFVPPGYSISSARIPTGLWIAALENDWGTSKQEFDKALSFNFDDECASQYSLDQTVSQIVTASDRNAQDWNLNYFKPIASPNLEKISDIIESDLYNFDSVLDNVITTYTDFHWVEKKHCQKLHVLIIPDTTRHPNLNISFAKNGINKVNGQVLEQFKQKLYNKDQEKKVTKTPSICSLGVLEEMCRNVLSGNTSSNFKNLDGSKLYTYQVGCAIFEDKDNYFLDGFDSNLLYSPNSRSLSITISKNPGGYNEIGHSVDDNGDYYYEDLDLGILEIKSNSATLDIVYPIQSNAGSANYYGILSTEVSTDIRLPAFTQVYGEPVNTTNNNVSSFKIINNITDNSLNPKLDPYSNQVKSYMTVITGGGSDTIITTPDQYYNYVKNLNNYNLETPMKTVEVTLAGPPNQFGNFIKYLNPSYGLNQLSLSISDNGVKTSLSFSDRPKTLPKQEAILNNIGPRIKGNYN
jgi:hypothetical protein